MDYKEAIKCLKIYLREYEESYKEFKLKKFLEIIEVYELAIQALEKQIPKKPNIKPWNAASCSCCENHLSESLGDGYYRHWTSLKFCECGQKLDWD